MFSPIYDGRLTNHLPMMRESLVRLGVPDDVRLKIEEHYIQEKRLEDAEQSEYGRRFLELRKVYSGVDLKEFLCDKKYTIASGLFHHFIRLYFSLGDEEEQASALAYFHLQKQEKRLVFPVSNDLSGDLEKLIDKRVNTSIEYKELSTMSKFDVIIHSSLRDFFRSIDQVNIRELLDIFLRMYERTKSFYVLHVLTGFQAILGLKDFLDLDEYIKEFYKYAQIYIAFGDDFKNSFKHFIKLDEAVSLAGTLVDAHDVKLLYSLTELWKIDQNPLIEKIAYDIVKG